MSLAFAIWALILLVLLDARCGLLPEVLAFLLLWGGLSLVWSGETLDYAFACAALTYLALRLLGALFWMLRGKDDLSGGDIKLMSPVGVWLGWPDVS